MFEMHTLNGQLYRFDPQTGATWQLLNDVRGLPTWQAVTEPPQSEDDDTDEDEGDSDKEGEADEIDGSHFIRRAYLDPNIPKPDVPWRERKRVTVRTMTPDGVERALMIEEFAPLAVAFDAMWIGYLHEAGLMERNDAMGLWVKKPEAPVAYVVRDPAHLDNMPMPRMFYDRGGASMHLHDQPERVFTLEATDQEVAPIGHETPSMCAFGMGAAPETTEGTIPTASPIPDTRGTVRFIGQRKATDGGEGEGEGEEERSDKPEPDYRSSAAWE